MPDYPEIEILTPWGKGTWQFMPHAVRFHSMELNLVYNGVTYRRANVTFLPTDTDTGKYDKTLAEGTGFKVTRSGYKITRRSGTDKANNISESGLKKSVNNFLPWLVRWLESNQMAQVMMEESAKEELIRKRQTIVKWMNAVETRLEDLRELFTASINGNDINPEEFSRLTRPIYNHEV